MHTQEDLDSASPTTAAPTQNQLILERLMQSAGEWVPMPELAQCSGSMNVHSRISNLRDRGHVIEVRLQGIRPKHSFYRLVPQRSEPTTP